ncbi:hypothetical protein [Nocardia sp. CA-119907]|uniref:hypothetical protein n=1 Tax=Nocardia sp. CA-119907 TaxID=3239973 RepID=UPI003D98387B
MHSDGPKSESFWKSVPGLLTGIAAVLTALATVIGTLYGVGVIKIGERVSDAHYHHAPPSHHMR